MWAVCKKVIDLYKKFITILLMRQKNYEILAWTIATDDMADPVVTTPVKKEPLSQSDFEYLSFLVLGSTYSDDAQPITEKWVDAQNDRLSRDPSANFGIICNSSSRLFLYLANREVQKLNNYAIKIDPDQIPVVAKTALHLFQRAEDADGAPDLKTARIMIETACKKAKIVAKNDTSTQRQPGTCHSRLDLEFADLRTQLDFRINQSVPSKPRLV